MTNEMKSLIFSTVEAIQAAAMTEDMSAAQSIKSALFANLDNTTAQAVWEMSIAIAKGM